MKTCDMIKELLENPNKRFKLKDEELYLENIDGEVNLGEIYWFRDDDRWEEVEKRVDFMTAVKSGKKIGVEYFKIHYRNMTLPDLFYQLQQHYSDTTIRFVILRGKWYIEDSEDKMFEINKNYNMDCLEDIKRIPMIPKFVAEWYESEGKRSSWWNWFYKWGRDESRSDLETKTIRWMQDFNEEKFVDIFKCGYKVEKEVKIPIPSKNEAVFKKKEIDNTMWINYSYHCQEIAKLEEEIRTLRGITLLILELNGI